MGVPRTKADPSKSVLPESLKQAWAKDPVMFIETCFTDPNGQPVVLSQAQKNIINGILNNKKISIQSGTGIGKTALLSWMIIWAVAVLNPIKIVVVTPTAGQSLSGLWPELMKWLGLANPILSGELVQAMDRVYSKSRPSNMMIKRTFDPSNEESIAGVHENFVWWCVDEATGCPDFVFDKGKNVFTSLGGKMIVAFNPARTDCFAEYTQTILDGWTRFKYNIFSPECQREGFHPENVAQEYRSDPRTTEGTYAWTVYILGEFWLEETDDTLLSRAMITNAQKDPPPPCMDGPVWWGCDIGGVSGRDRTALSKRRSNHKLGLTKIWEYRTTDQIADLIRIEYDNTPPEDKPDGVWIDVNGLGVGVYDNLFREGIVPVKKHFAVSTMDEPQTYQNRKAELYFRMREWFRMPDCYVDPNDDEFLQDIVDIRFSQHDLSGKYKIEGKNEMLKRGKRSPDLADSFAMCFESKSPLNPKKKPRQKPRMRPRWMR